MNSLQIECILHCDEVLHNSVIGVFAIDELTRGLATVMKEEAGKLGSKTVGIIINTDLSREKGTHWVTLVYEKRTTNRPLVEIFDSLGTRSPLQGKELVIERFVGHLSCFGEKKKKAQVMRNEGALQTVGSKTCGY